MGFASSAKSLIIHKVQFAYGLDNELAKFSRAVIVNAVKSANLVTICCASRQSDTCSNLSIAACFLRPFEAIGIKEH